VALVRLLLLLALNVFLFGDYSLLELEPSVLARLKLLRLTLVLWNRNLHHVVGGFRDLRWVHWLLLVAKVACRLFRKLLHVAAVRLA